MQDSHDPSSAATDAASPATDRESAALSSTHAPDAAAARQACAVEAASDDVVAPSAAPAGRGLAEPPLAVQRGFRGAMALVAALGCLAGAGQALAAGAPWPYVGLACAFWAVLVAGLAKYARLPLTADENAVADPSAP